MARYSIYIKDKYNEYIIPLKKSDGTKEKKFDLEQLDRYLSQFPSKDIFLAKMYKDGVIKATPLDCYIGYTYNKKVVKKPIFFHNKLIYDASRSYIHAKEQAIDKKKTTIPLSNEITSFINEIIDLGVNDNEAFKSMFYSKNFPKHVYDLLNEYRKLLKKEDYPSKQDDIKELKEQINYNIRKYNYFRSIYLWKELLNDKRKNDKQEYDQMNINDYINNLNHKNETETDIEQREEDYEEELKEIAIEELRKRKIFLTEISNPNIDYYFNEGGLEEVLNNCDMDEIESLSDDEKEYIGYKRR